MRAPRILRLLGPGLITGSSDADPTSVVSFAMVGSSLGTALLWVPFLLYPLLAAIQMMCARAAIVTGAGLASIIRQHYAARWLYPAVVALLVSNTITIGADLGAVAAAVNLLVPVPAPVLVPFVGLGLFGLQVLEPYRRIEAVFKWLTLALFSYIFSALLTRPNAWQVLHATFVPQFHLGRAHLAAFLALVGTSISPYLFFWQASSEVEAQREVHGWHRRAAKGLPLQELHHAAIDIHAGTIFYALATYFILLAPALTLYPHGHPTLRTANEVAIALRPFAGPAAPILLAIGLIGSGCLAIPVIAGSSAYALAETFKWPRGLNLPIWKARRFYGVIGASLALGVAMNYLGINPLDALFWASVLNGFLAPPILVLLMLVANNRQILGEHVNGPVLNFLGGLATLGMAIAAIALWFTGGGS